MNGSSLFHLLFRIKPCDQQNNMNCFTKKCWTTLRHITSRNTLVKKRTFCSSSDNESNKELITVHYVNKDGSRTTLRGKIGNNVMHLAQQNGIEIEGACEASLACSTCHVYVKEDFYSTLPEADEKEDDMLDMAPFLKSNSRLSCQIILTKDLDGIEVTLPPATRNFYVDGKVPSHH